MPLTDDLNTLWKPYVCKSLSSKAMRVGICLPLGMCHSEQERLLQSLTAASPLYNVRALIVWQRRKLKVPMF